MSKAAARLRRANCSLRIQREANRGLRYFMIHMKPEGSFLENSLSFMEAILLLLFNLGQLLVGSTNIKELVIFATYFLKQ